MHIPINFDLFDGFLLLFHLENVSFAKRTLAEAKVNTSLFVSLLSSFFFGHSSRYEYFLGGKTVQTNTHKTKPV